MKTLKLTLKKKWFDMIASGEKTEEYRIPGPWIRSRLDGRSYDFVEFKNGYGKHVPTVTLEFKGWSYGHGEEKWGAQPLALYAVIKLGKVITP